MNKHLIALALGFSISSAAIAAPITIQLSDRIAYTGISQDYCVGVARAAAQARTKQTSHYEVIDVLNAGLDRRGDISDVMRKAAKRMVTLLVSRVYLDKPSNSELESLAKVECAWSNQLLEGVEALNQKR